MSGETVQARGSVRVADFLYELPQDRIASAPVEPRDAARLFVHERAQDRSEHRIVRDLPELLRPGDLLVLNDTRVLPHRLVGRLASGGRAEALILERSGGSARGYLKPARKARLGVAIAFEGGALEITPIESLGDGMFRFALRAPAGGDVGLVLETVGRAPLPPYIRRADGDDAGVDRARYQTVFARVPGAVAAPTAGLHFTGELLARLAARGIGSAFVTLHVGEGTFAPLRVDRIEDHRMHEERYELPAATATAIAATRARGGRVVAVGTTAARVLETCARDDRNVESGSGTTELFLFPGRELRVVDALLTNFHLPGSTLLMLVAAFCGRERVLRLYQEAIERGYRFFSYGDAMLLV